MQFVPNIRRFIFHPAAIALASALLASAPGTPSLAQGQDFFSAIISPEQEARMGREQHPKILKQFGGAYEDPALNRYVTSIGELLLRTTETPDASFTFTILNTPVVNAFALPGGYVYITRGLLALADNEAQLAGVLAHEIGHITARHSAQRYGQSLAATLGLTFLGVLAESEELNQIAGIGANLFLKSYSRDHEFEADKLGLVYMSRARFSPNGMTEFLRNMKAHDELQQKLVGQGGFDPLMGLLSTHPRTVERVERAYEAAHVNPPPNPIIARDIYLRQIDGLLYGDDPAQGYVRGRSFIHPELKIRFDVPEGFTLINSEEVVLARNKSGARIIFDAAQRPQGQNIESYLTRTWLPKQRLGDIETINVNGFPAATATARVKTDDGIMDLRLIAIAYDAARVYRFMFVSPTRQTAGLNMGFRRTTYSFRTISDAEAAAVRPLRLVIEAVESGDTMEKFASRMPYETYRLERFKVLNGLSGGEEAHLGGKVKLVAE